MLRMGVNFLDYGLPFDLLFSSNGKVLVSVGTVDCVDIGQGRQSFLTGCITRHSSPGVGQATTILGPCLVPFNFNRLLLG